MSYEQILIDFRRIMDQLKSETIDFLPNFLIAILIMIAGILIARLFKSIISRLSKKLSGFIPGQKFAGKARQLRLDRYTLLVSNIFFWIILFFFLTAATEVLGLPIITAWLSRFVQYLPNILAAALIIFAGIIGGAIVRDLTSTTASSAGFGYGEVLGTALQYAILLIVIVVGVQQIGIDLAFLTGLLSIVIAAVLLGAALAFGIGARNAVSNILASYYLQKNYMVGNIVRIGEYEGRIIQITPTAVLLENLDGVITIPALKFTEQISVLVRKDSADAE